MVNSKKLSPEDIHKGQEKIKEEIYTKAKELGISTDDLWPLPDGVFNIEGYCQSSPRIMWIFKTRGGKKMTNWEELKWRGLIKDTAV